MMTMTSFYFDMQICIRCSGLIMSVMFQESLDFEPITDCSTFFFYQSAYVMAASTGSDFGKMIWNRGTLFLFFSFSKNGKTTPKHQSPKKSRNNFQILFLVWKLSRVEKSLGARGIVTQPPGFVLQKSKRGQGHLSKVWACLAKRSKKYQMLCNAPNSSKITREKGGGWGWVLGVEVLKTEGNRDGLEAARKGKNQ